MKKIFNALARGAAGPARRSGLQPSERELGNLIWRPSGTSRWTLSWTMFVDAGC